MGDIYQNALMAILGAAATVRMLAYLVSARAQEHQSFNSSRSRSLVPMKILMGSASRWWLRAMRGMFERAQRCKTMMLPMKPKAVCGTLELGTY
jgi:hypothetical protein